MAKIRHFMHYLCVFIEKLVFFGYTGLMFTNVAKQAMTTKGQKACVVIDHLIEALVGDPSAPLRRAMVLADIDQFPGTTQLAVMERLHIHRSALNREIEWLFNYGCIMMNNDKAVAPESREIKICGESKDDMEAALGYFENGHEGMKYFLRQFADFIGLEKPTLREARIVAALFEKNGASKHDLLNSLHHGATPADYRAYEKLVETGVIVDG